MDLIARAKQLAESAGGGWLTADAVERLASEAIVPIERLMLDLIPLASTFASPALSGFKVGAVAQGASGAMYFGANLEFDACPLNQTVHAEQSTVVNAAAHGETGLARLAVSAPPCGYCRQFLFELATADQLLILLSDRAPTKLTDYLPGAFGPADLGVSGRLLSPGRHKLDWVSPPANISDAMNAALQAARASYAPYTNALAGAGLTTSDGYTFSGPYLENAAFNPSVSPLNAAAVAAALRGRSLGAVVEAVIVQTPGSKVDHAAAARMVLQKYVPDVAVQEYQVRVS